MLINLAGIWLRLSPAALLKPLKRLLNLCLPARCHLCDKPLAQPLSYLCAPCFDDLLRNRCACPVCALPMPQPEICPQCLAKPPPFHRGIAAYIYCYPLAGMINRWKHQRDCSALPLLSTQLAQQLRVAYQADDWPELLLPVPLHWRRLLQRGFNQSEQLAWELHRQLQIAVDCEAIKRIEHAHSQQGLNRKQRLHNLRQTFTANRQLPDHVALIDDVMTTGATCTQLAKLVQDHGAKRVDVWLIARTP